MSVTTFLTQINVGLISEKYLMATISDTYGRGINLITIADTYAVEHTSHHQCNRIGRAIRQTSLHYLFVIHILKSARYVHSIRCSVGLCQKRRLYDIKRIF